MNLQEIEDTALALIEDLNNKVKELEVLNIKELKILLTYEIWCDGLDANQVEQYYKDLTDWSQEQIINDLEDVFDYD